MEKFLENFLGTTDVPTYLAAFVLAFIAAMVSLLIKIGKRNRVNPKTPKRFSLSFMFRDNLRRLMLGFLLTFLAFRFSNELFGAQLTMWFAVGIGAATDQLAAKFGKVEKKARE